MVFMQIFFVLVKMDFFIERLLGKNTLLLFVLLP